MQVEITNRKEETTGLPIACAYVAAVRSRTVYFDVLLLSRRGYKAQLPAVHPCLVPNRQLPALSAS